MKLHLSERLYGIRFYSMPAIPYDILFKRQSIKNECYIEDRLYRAPFALLKSAFFPDLDYCEYHKFPNSKILFYMSDPKRKSNEIDFMKAVGTVETADRIIERHKKPSFSFLGFFLFFFLFPVWYYQLIGRKVKIIEKFQVAKCLVDLYRIKRFFENLQFEQYRLLVCFYDSIPHECLLTLMFKEKGIQTASLQHGQFNAWRENTYINCGLELRSTPSDYLLCWNKFTQDEAVKCGLSKERIPIVGILSNIGRGSIRCISNKKDVFGVVLSHPSWHQDNLEIIRAANFLAKEKRLKYYLKLHPNYDEYAFVDFIDKGCCIGNVKKGMDLLQYANMVDFSIVGSSSVFVELVYFYHNIIRYSTKLPSDKYRNITIGNVFHDPKRIVECYENSSEEGKKELFDYLCETDNAEALYRSFFARFVA